MKRTKFNSLIQIMGLILVMFVALLLNGKEVMAAGPLIDTSRTGSITLSHSSVDDESLAGVQSHVYLIATVDENSNYTITDEFRECFSDPDFFNNKYNYDDWKSCVMYDGVIDSDKLYSYIHSRGIQETATAMSDSEGKTYYRGLTLGVYYVLSDKLVGDGYTHTFANFVYPLPILENDETTGGYSVNYTPSVAPKKSKIKNTEVVYCNLYKRWNDNGYEDHRPSSVTFNIYCDDVLMETVVLTAQNNWHYEWSKEGVHTFFVEEVSAGAGYSSSMTIYQNGHNAEFVCTNTYNPPTPPDTPDTPGNPPGDTPEEPGLPSLPEVLGAIRDLPEVLGARRLPQTGQLWWPLPILILAGLFLMIKGIRKTRNS